MLCIRSTSAPPRASDLAALPRRRPSPTRPIARLPQPPHRPRMLPSPQWSLPDFSLVHLQAQTMEHTWTLPYKMLNLYLPQQGRLTPRPSAAARRPSPTPQQQPARPLWSTQPRQCYTARAAALHRPVERHSKACCAEPLLAARALLVAAVARRRSSTTAREVPPECVVGVLGAFGGKMGRRVNYFAH